MSTIIEKLLFSKIQFKKVKDELTLEIDHNIKNDILDFVDILNNENMDYEKKNNMLIVPIIKSKQNIATELNKQTETPNRIQDLYDNLDDLNLIYKKFSKITINFSDSNGNEYSGIIDIYDKQNNNWKITLETNYCVGDTINITYNKIPSFNI